MQPFSFRLRHLAAALSICAAFAPVPAASAESFFLLGSGGVKGIYFPVASRLCRVINERIRAHGHRCGIAASRGSLDNLRGVAEGRLAFGIVQSNIVLEHARAGNGAIRSVATLYPEPIHIVVRGEGGIDRLSDLGAAIVNVGEESSGTLGVATTLLDAIGVTLPEDRLRYAGPSDQAQNLCSGAVDVLIFVSGLRNSSVTEAFQRCDARLLPLPAELIGTLAGQVRGFEPITIPRGTYPGQERDIASIGPVARLVTRADTGDDLVELMVDAVSGRLGDVSFSHPAMAGTSTKSIKVFFEGEPLHPAILLRPQGRPRSN